MAEYPRTYEFTQSSGGSGTATAYQDIDGTIHEITGGGAESLPLHVVKKLYQNSRIPPVKVGDTFEVVRAELGEVLYGSDYTFDALTFRCTEVSVSDEMVDFWNGQKRLWEIVLTGTEAIGDDPSSGGSTLRQTVEISEEVNGAVERSVAGTLIVLRASTTPIGRITLTGYGDSPTPPKSPGDTVEHNGKTYTVTSTRSSREDIEEDGVLIATLYQYTIEGEV